MGGATSVFVDDHPFEDEDITTAGSGLVFHNTYNKGVTADYRNAIISAEQLLEESHYKRFDHAELQL